MHVRIFPISIAFLMNLCFTSTSALAQPIDEVNVGYFIEWPTPASFAQEKKYYDKVLGVKVNWVPFDTGTGMSAALASGFLHIGYSLGIPPLANSLSQGLPLKIVGIAASYPENQNCVVRSDMKISKTNAHELTGKKIGLPIGTLLHFDFLKQMDYFGVDVSTMEISDMAPQESVNALADGKLDMACGWGGALRRMKEHGNVLLEGKEKEQIGIRVFDVITTSEEFLIKYPDLVENFMKVTTDMNARFVIDGAESMAPVIAKSAGMGVEETLATMSGFSFPNAREQASKKWLGEAVLTYVKEVSDFFEDRGNPNTTQTISDDVIEPSFIKRLADVRTLEIMFGTNRKPGMVNGEKVFTSERDTKLHRGVITVSVPEHRIHHRGKIERPWEVKIPFTDIKILGEAEDPSEHFTIISLELMSDQQFFSNASARINDSISYQDQALIYIHGYNVSFEDAGYRLAQMVYDMGFDGVPLLYSWPSAGGIAYVDDLDSSEVSSEYIVEFVENILESLELKKVHIVAHSMGARALIRAIENMSTDQNIYKSQINEIVLAAPDIDIDIFEKVFAKIAGKYGGMTLYASSNDKAMVASRIGRAGRPRVGDVPADNGPVVMEGMHTIDVSKLGSSIFGLEHSDYADEPVLLKDIGLLMSQWDTLRNPAKRGGGLIQRRNSSGKMYWQY